MSDVSKQKPIFSFFIISLGAFIVHFGIWFLKGSPIEMLTPRHWYLVYAFMIPTSVIGLYFIKMRFDKSQKITSIGKNYIAYTVLKMILAIVFLLPWLLNKDESSRPMVITFFTVFFPFLLVETILLVRLLNTPLDEKVKNEENQGE